MYVELKNINKTYGSYQASRNVNFGIEKGKLIGLLGPSGSGKTTILRMIAGLETPDSGEVIIDGKVVNDVPASQRGIGFVFQNYALFRYMTVYDNVAFGLKVQKADKKKIDARVRELIKLVGLEDWKKDIQASYPAVRGKGWHLPEPLLQIPRCCFWMSPLQPLMQNPSGTAKLVKRDDREAGNYQYFRYS